MLVRIKSVVTCFCHVSRYVFSEFVLKPEYLKTNLTLFTALSTMMLAIGLSTEFKENQNQSAVFLV